MCLEAIAAIRARYRESDLPRRLARWHADADGAFHGWADAWLSAEFRDWNIEAEVAASRCPILAIQGTEDEYGTLEQVRGVARLRPGTELLVLERCRHSPHLDRPDAVLAAVARFARRHLGLDAGTDASLPGVATP